MTIYPAVPVTQSAKGLRMGYSRVHYLSRRTSTIKPSTCGGLTRYAWTYLLGQLDVARSTRRQRHNGRPNLHLHANKEDGDQDDRLAAKRYETDAGHEIYLYLLRRLAAT
jgi:hypothetical protein